MGRETGMLPPLLPSLELYPETEEFAIVWLIKSVYSYGCVVGSRDAGVSLETLNS